MESLRKYLTLKGWKADLEKTLTDLNDLGILVRRVLDIPRNIYLGEMTSRELENFSWIQSARRFNNEEEFQSYAMNNLWPLGRCLIGWGKNAIRYDDTLFLEKETNFKNLKYPI